jgi:hypothetical protein
MTCTVRGIVREWLIEHGYDGLYCEECACANDDLFPCGDTPDDCEAGYVMECPNPHECEFGDEEHWHIGPGKEEQQ